MDNHRNDQHMAAGAWQAEFDELSRSYSLKTVALEVQNHHLELVQVANMDDLLDSIADVEDLPFWAEIWPAAVGLATYIFRNGAVFSGKRILELGAGTGLAGIAAKLAGGEVTQSDFIQAAFQFIRINCLRNQVPVEPLLLADWRHFPDDIGRFDFVIGADILYEKTLHSPLIRVFNRTLQANGTIYLADPGRDWARQFVNQILAGGWNSTEIQIPVIYQERTFRIDIYKLTPPGNRVKSVSL